MQNQKLENFLIIILYLFAFSTHSKIKFVQQLHWLLYEEADGEFTQSVAKDRALVNPVVSGGWHSFLRTASTAAGTVREPFHVAVAKNCFSNSVILSFQFALQWLKGSVTGFLSTQILFGKFLRKSSVFNVISSLNFWCCSVTFNIPHIKTWKINGFYSPVVKSL